MPVPRPSVPPGPSWQMSAFAAAVVSSESWDPDHRWSSSRWSPVYSMPLDLLEVRRRLRASSTARSQRVYWPGVSAANDLFWDWKHFLQVGQWTLARL